MSIPFPQFGTLSQKIGSLSAAALCVAGSRPVTDPLMKEVSLQDYFPLDAQCFTFYNMYNEFKKGDIMSLATVSSKGQVTLPAKIRHALGIRSKDKVQFLVRDNEIVIRPLRSFRQLRGSLSPRKGDHRKAMRNAVARHVIGGGK